MKRNYILTNWKIYQLILEKFEKYLKGKIDKLDVDNLVPSPVDLSKLSNVAKNDVVKKDVYNAKIKYIEDKIPNVSNLGKKLTITQELVTLKIKLLLIMVMINILLLKNLIS